ncbi:MAG: hypothetical protein DHS20C18_27200 [Saprospiraceae bacterium]|nr:MAG: hypothetical protein DHS20C18_27200 [Saprospiraceae bacterium]
MKKLFTSLGLVSLSLCLFAHNDYANLTKDFRRGKAEVKSMSVLQFGPEGILFIGDSKSGKVFALDTEDRKLNDSKEGFELVDVEGKLAGLLGTDAKGIIIHDVAVNPISQNIYLAVSRADALKQGFWKLPNDITYANILLRLTPDGKFEEVGLDNIKHDAAEVPAMIKEGSENWRKSDKRTEAITDLAFADGKLYIAGLSNEEFASAVRVLSFPFGKEAQYSTIEVWHVAHGKSETEAPIRTLLPYQLEGQPYLLAAYTCTPFVSIPVADLKPGKHVKSTTLGEFGFGNMPIDIISFQKEGKDYILMSNTSKAMIRIDPMDIAKYKTGLTEPLKEGEYAVGLEHAVLSKIGITQIDNLNADNVLLLQRMPNGYLNLNSYPTKWL